MTQETTEQDMSKDRLYLEKFEKLVTYLETYVPANEQQLRATYGSKYVAIAHGKGVVDADSDRNVLERRLKSMNLKEEPVILNTLDNILDGIRNPKFVDVEEIEVNGYGRLLT